jgi:hypothetical protein
VGRRLKIFVQTMCIYTYVLFHNGAHVMPPGMS